MKEVKAGDQFLWLQQEYVQTLATVGEFRFFCVSGEPIRMVITSKSGPGEPNPGGTCSLEGIKTMLGLQEIRYVTLTSSVSLAFSQNLPRSLVNRGKPVGESNVFHSDQDCREAKRAEEELAGFVKTFLRHLKDMDGPNTSLQVFCRVDVGIFIKGSGVVSYFVNEVERGITTSLWVVDGPHTSGVVGMSIVDPLRRWILSEKVRLDVRACRTMAM